MRVDRLVCTLAGAVLLIGGSYADTANNSFASVSGNGVVADGESGFCIKNVEGTVEITVNERPGWKCEKGAPYGYAHNEGDVDNIRFDGLDDEETATISISNVWECVHETTNIDYHVSSPGAEDKGPFHMIAAYSSPASKGAVLSFDRSIVLEGRVGHHTNIVIALRCPNPKCDYGIKNPIEESDIVVDPSPVVASADMPEGGILQADGRIVYPQGTHKVCYKADFSNDCEKCGFHKEVLRTIDVYEATSMADKYVGLDRTDAGYAKEHTMSGSVTLKATPPHVAFNWNVWPHCKIKDNNDGESVVCIVKRIAGDVPGGKDFEYSSRYRQERLSCGINIWDDCTPNCKADTSTTNNFTVVKVDVVIDDLSETLEEGEGAFTYYVPDDDAPIWAEEWTNSLKDVSITCEPHDGEMSNQIVRLKFPEKHLYAKNKDGVYVEAKTAYTVEELNKTKFKLHGHKKSAKYKDKEIVAIHEKSLAIDKAKFTVFGRPWLVPDYDRKNGIEDGEKGADAIKARGGVIPFRFWINDDDDSSWEGWKIFWIFTYWFEKGNICEENTDIPGAGNNFDDDKVNGRADLVDFAPVLIDISDVFPDNIPDNIRNTFTWKLDSDCLNIVWTDLAAAKAAAFHTQEVPHCGTGLKQQSYEADSVEIGYGREFDKAFATKIREVGKLVVLIEGRSAGQLFRISGHAPGTKAWTWGAVNISISKVEDMYRWMDLRYVCKDETQGDDSGRDKPADFGGSEDADGPVNNPDSNCNGDSRDGRHIVFVHGFNVNRDQARGWGAEFFKRLWQTGCTSKYTAADWSGDVGQITIPFDGKDSLNYYANVYNAFKTSEEFATNCSKIAASDRLVLAAHSLGNMLASSTISDRGVVPSRYYMLNAAVAMEAYDGSSYNELMKDEAWKGLDRHPSQSPYWHTLSIFRPGDFRRTLTWNKRFSGLDNAVNCHSESDEILRDIEKGAWWGEDMGSVWTIQEKYKGSVVLPIANVLPRTSITREGGWGFNPTHIGVDVGRVVDTEKIKKLTDVQLLTDPVFTPFVTQEARLYSSEAFAVNDSKEQYLLRAKLLADAIPALSYSAGANETGGMIKDNVDYMKKCEADGWPRKNKAWHHSDLKNVAYYFTYKLYEKISNDE